MLQPHSSSKRNAAAEALPGGRTTLASVAGALASLATLTALELLGSDAFRDLSDPVKVAVVRSVGAIPALGVTAYVAGQALVAASGSLAGAVRDVAEVWRSHAADRVRVAELEAKLEADRATFNAEIAKCRAAYSAERQKREYAETLLPVARPAAPAKSTKPSNGDSR